MTLALRFGDQTIRIRVRFTASQVRGSPRALAEHVVEDHDDDAPLAFVLTGPQGLQRHHRLVDRSGLVLSEAKGLDTGLRALSHLTVFLPPPPGTARIRARAAWRSTRWR